MALTQTPCEYPERHRYCGGYFTDTEEKMHELDPSRSAQEYHDIMNLFERAYDLLG